MSKYEQRVNDLVRREMQRNGNVPEVVAYGPLYAGISALLRCEDHARLHALTTAMMKLLIVNEMNKVTDIFEQLTAGKMSVGDVERMMTSSALPTWVK